MSLLRRLHRWQSERPTWAAVAGLVAIALSVSYWFLDPSSTEFWEPRRLRTSSPKGGSYQQTIEHLVEYINAHPADLGFKIELLNLDSAGSLTTLEQIGHDEVDLGLVQGNTVVDDEHVGAVLELYSELYLFYTNRSDVATLSELCREFEVGGEKLRVASIGKGSQVYEDLFVILEVFGLPEADTVHMALDYRDSQAALREGRIDLAFIVGASQNEVVRQMAWEFRLLGLTHIDGLIANLPGVSGAVIPAASLGNRSPQRPVRTLTTPATMVANRRVSSNMVRRMTRYLLEKRANLRKSLPHLDIRRLREEAGIDLHEGAERALQPERFWWIARYESHLKFVLSLGGFLVGLGTLAFHVWKHRSER